MSEGITEYYGGSGVAMAGKDCLIITGDKRIGNRFLTIGTKKSSIKIINKRCLISMNGFLPDIQYLFGKIEEHVELFQLTENRSIDVYELANMISYILYSFRTQPKYVDPIVVGLTDNNKPVLIQMDCVGCKTTTDTFVVAGTAHKNLSGMCEALYREGMDSEELFENTMQAFLNSLDRDALSGWGAECYILTPNGIVRREVKGRND
ncbi:PSB3A [Hepatospora eriocheir]|uniref:PSB3A n=1 Tax=Hepatospora eriocheir TaxID=1081669 RepID=A0A1X0Q9W2_9MICR|nr:PSB3A [Hepatospora eriocheir]ORE00530.1 PSB3A [Hepatospora eriocheir]